MKISTIANIDSRHFQANVLIYLSLFQLYMRIDLIKSTKDKRTNYTKLWKNDHRKSKNERQKDREREREREKALCFVTVGNLLWAQLNGEENK